MRWYPNEDFKCSLCGKQEDSHSHSFFQCEFSSKVWKNTKKMLVYKGLQNDLYCFVDDLARYPALKDIRNVLNKVVAAALYFIWMERSKRKFMNKQYVNEVCQKVMEFIWIKLSSLKVKKSKNVDLVAALRDLKVVDHSLQLV
ncbi:uncharacterized protein [Rutidosis leptorrhynchoides]|uniref:uncharacterized protein n=1 Tax=Rutidosis leptorrhynchoides TaxID=125765 RepID=UPI003A990EA4